MGRKRFYCDYCDCSFPDSKEAREKHRNGVNHKKLKAEYFEAFQSAQEIIDREQKKKTPCRRFWTTNDCQYGPECYFSHLAPAQMQALVVQAAEEEMDHLVPVELRGKSLLQWATSRGFRVGEG